MCLRLLATKNVVYIYRCSGVMGKYAAGELKPPTIGEFNNSMLISSQNQILMKILINRIVLSFCS